MPEENNEPTTQLPTITSAETSSATEIPTTTEATLGEDDIQWLSDEAEAGYVPDNYPPRKPRSIQTVDPGPVPENPSSDKYLRSLLTDLLHYDSLYTVTSPGEEKEWAGRRRHNFLLKSVAEANDMGLETYMVAIDEPWWVIELPSGTVAWQVFNVYTSDTITTDRKVNRERTKEYLS